MGRGRRWTSFQIPNKKSTPPLSHACNAPPAWQCMQGSNTSQIAMTFAAWHRHIVLNIAAYIYTNKNLPYTQPGLRGCLQECSLGPGSQIGPKRPKRLLYGKVLYSLYGKVPIEAKRKEKVSTGCNANSYLYICRHGINTSLTYQSHWHTCMDELSISSCDHFHANCFLKVYYCYRSKLKHKSLA